MFHPSIYSFPVVEFICIKYNSRVEMTKYLLSLPGAEKLFLFGERFTQDPLENYFGQQRARCGRSDNPSVNQCLQNASALRIQKSAALDPIY